MATAKESRPAPTDRPTPRQCDSIAAELRRRREAALRVPPLGCGCGDPLTCRCRDQPNRQAARTPVLVLSEALAALRRAWPSANDADRKTLGAIAAVLVEVARPKAA